MTTPNISALVAELQQQGVEVSRNGDKLKLKGSLQQLPEVLLNQVKQHKTDILAWLSQQNPIDWFPLSVNQQAMWAMYKLMPNSPAFNMLFACRLPSGVDVNALKHACDLIVKRHDMLRTAFAENKDGIAQQGVQDNTPLQWAEQHCKFEQTESTITQWTDHPVDLSKGPIRFLSVSSDTGQRHFAFCVHHIAVDFWSCQLLLAELSAIYDALAHERNVRLPAITGTYRRYVQWQSDYLTSDRGHEDLTYWQKTLSGSLPFLTLPYDQERPGVMSFRGKMHRLILPRSSTEALRKTALQHGVTPSTLIMSAYSMWLSLLSGQQDILIGTPAAIRPLPELEWSIGDYANPIVVRSHFPPEQSFLQRLPQVQENIISAIRHQDSPFATVVEALKIERGIRFAPVFQALFMWHKPNQKLLEKTVGQHNSIFMEPLFCTGLRGSIYDVMLSMVDLENDLICNWAYNCDLFSEATFLAMANSFAQLLQQLPERLNLPLHDWHDTLADTLSQTDSAPTIAPICPTPPQQPWWQQVQQRWQQGSAHYQPDWQLHCGDTQLNAQACLDRWHSHQSHWQPLLAPQGSDNVLVVKLPFTNPLDTLFDALAIQALGHEVQLITATDPLDIGPAASHHHLHASVRLQHLQPLQNAQAEPVRWLCNIDPHHHWLISAFAGLVYGKELVLGDGSDQWLLSQWLVPANSAVVVTQRTFQNLLQQVRLTQQASAGHWSIAVYGMIGSLQQLYQQHQLEPGLQHSTCLAYYWPEQAPWETLYLPLQDRQKVQLSDLIPFDAPLTPGSVLNDYPYQSLASCDYAAQRDLVEGITVDWLSLRVHDRPDYICHHGRAISLSVLCQTSLAHPPIKLAGNAAINLAAIDADQYNAGDQWALWLCPQSDTQTELQSHFAGLPAPATISWISGIPYLPSGHIDWNVLLELPRHDYPSTEAHTLIPPPARPRWHHHHIQADTYSRWESPSLAADVSAPNNEPAESGFIELHSTDPFDGAATNCSLAQKLWQITCDYPDNFIGFLQKDGTTLDRLTYPEFWCHAAAGAHQLLASHPQARSVIVLADDTRDLLMGFWSAHLAGLPVLSILAKHSGNHALTEHHQRSLQLCSTRMPAPVLVARPQWADAIHCLSLDLPIATEFYPAADHPADGPAQTNNLPGVDPQQTPPDALAMLVLTSGSSGTPKLVQHSHRTMQAHNITSAQALPVTPKDCSFNWMPIDHSGALVYSHMVDIAAGSSQIHADTDILLQRPLLLLDLLTQYRITRTWGPNFVYGLLNQHIERTPVDECSHWDFSYLHRLISGGEAVNAATCRTLFKNLEPYGLSPHVMTPAWGMSETGSAILYCLDYDPFASNAANVGTPIAGVSVRVSSDQKLYVKGPCMSIGYLGDHFPIDEDGWMDTGDLASIDDGKVSILGRDSQKLKILGESFNSTDIEATLQKINGIRPGFCLALAARAPAEDSDNLALIIALDDPVPSLHSAEFAALFSTIQSTLKQAHGVQARWIIPIADTQFLKTSIGKVQRNAMAKQLQQGAYDAALQAVELALGSAQTSPQWFYTPHWQARAIRPVSVPSHGWILWPESSALSVDTYLPLTQMNAPITVPVSSLNSPTDWNWNALSLPENEHTPSLILPVSAFLPPLDQPAEALEWLAVQLQTLVATLLTRFHPQPVQLTVLTQPGAFDHGTTITGLMAMVQQLNQQHPQLCLQLIDDDQQTPAVLSALLSENHDATSHQLRHGVRYCPSLRWVEMNHSTTAMPAPFHGDANSVVLLASHRGRELSALLPALLEHCQSHILIIDSSGTRAIEQYPSLVHSTRVHTWCTDLQQPDALNGLLDELGQVWPNCLTILGGVYFPETDAQACANLERLHQWASKLNQPFHWVHWSSANGWLGMADTCEHALWLGQYHQQVQHWQQQHQQKQHRVQHIWLGWAPDHGTEFYHRTAESSWPSLVAALQQGWNQVVIGVNEQALSMQHRIAITSDHPAVDLWASPDCANAVAYRRPPGTELETRLQRLWCRLLDQPEIGIDDNFFLLGGHSLIAAQMTLQLQQQLNRRVPMALIFENPTIAELAQVLDQQNDANTDHLPELLRQPIPQLPERTRTEPSAAQKRLLFLQQLEGRRPTFNVPFALLIEGELELDLMQAALNDVLQRHAILRSHFEFTQGQFWLVENDACHYPLSVEDYQSFEQPLNAARDRFEAIANRTFDLQQAPLFTVELIVIGPQRYGLICNAHHAVFDGWSMGVLLKDLMDSYRHHKTGAPTEATPLVIQYADFAAWQKQWLRSDELQRQRAYWREQLRDLPTTLTLPTDFPRPPIMAHIGDERHFIIAPALHDQLNRFCQQHNLTLSMMLMGAYALLLNRYSGQSDLAIGAAVANRRHPQTEPLIGMFVNMLVIRHQLEPQHTVMEFLQRTKHTLLDAFAHEDVPFEQLVEDLQPERDLSSTPLFQAMFVLQNTPLGPMQAPGLSVRPLVRRSTVAKFDMSLQMAELQGELIGALEFNREVFRGETIERFLAQFQALLTSMMDQSHQSLTKLNFLTQEESRRVERMAAPQLNAQPSIGLWARLQQQAQQQPQAIAIEYDGQTINYETLLARATQLGEHLRQQSKGAEHPVAIVLPRSLDQSIAVLALIYSGACYLPIDPSYPIQRVRYMLEHSGANLLLSHAEIIDSLGMNDQPWLDVRTHQAPIDHGQAATPNQDQPLYVIYTSGSTGKPKGVEISHRSFLNLLDHCAQDIGIQHDDTWLAVASMSFDIAALDLLLPLTQGAKLILATPEQAIDGPWLNATLMQPEQQNGHCFMHGTPATWELISHGDWPGCPNLTILSGGEPLTPKLATKLLARVERLFNIYGPTETTIWALTHHVTAIDERPIPIGTPLANTQIQILDAQGQPVPTGVPGELYIGGAGVGIGYRHDPERTAKSFVTLPSGSNGTTSQRWYKTGDRVRWRDDGLVEFLGRVDHQVKVRGFRIELGEVEQALLAHADVRQSVAQVLPHPQQGNVLVAYVQTDHADTLTAATLKQTAAQRLPDYMLPSQILVCRAFPLTPNGKIDLKALAQNLEQQAPLSTEIVAPRNDTETQLHAIWESLLGNAHFGVTQNFFDVGGHSILAIQLVHRIQQSFDKTLPISQVFQLNSIEAMAAYINGESTPAPVEIETDGTLVCLKPGNPGVPPLILVHPVGGRALCYGTLAHQLPPEQPVYGLQLPTDTDGKAELTSIEAMAEHYIAHINQRWPNQPLYLGGWSLGGLVAFVMAEHLQSLGTPPLGLVLIDSSHPASHRERKAMEDNVLIVMAGLEMGLQLFQMPTELYMMEDQKKGMLALFERLHAMQLVPDTFEMNDLENRCRLIRQNEQAFLQFVPDQRRFEGSVLVLAARSQPAVRKDPKTLGWANYVEDCNVEVIDGDHFTVLQLPGVKLLAQQLTHWQQKVIANTKGNQ